jgi:hypothetical protein
MAEARIERTLTAGAPPTAVSLSETPAKEAKTEWRREGCPSVLRPGHTL